MWGEKGEKKVSQLNFVVLYHVYAHVLVDFGSNQCEYVDCIQDTFRACVSTPTKPLVHGMQFDQLNDIDDLVPRNLANWLNIRAK